MGLVGMADPAIEEPTINETAVLINNLAKMLMLVAGTSVAKDTGDLLANIFKNPDNANTALLEGIFDRLGNREVKSSSNQSTNNAPRTRVITKSTTTTRKIVDYSDDSRTSGNKPSVNISNNQRNNFQTNVTNNDRKTINMQNRTNVSLNEVGGRSAAAGVKVGAPRATSSSETGIKSNAADILNQTFAKQKSESDKLRNEWEFVKNGNSSSSKEVVKNFESASKDLDSAISAGEQSRIKTSMNQYVDAYKKEEKVAKEGYKDFAGKSAKLSNDLTMKQQQELRNISSAYKKAQVDYGKTSRRLSEVSQGNMSASEALRVKEKADKQRAKLMEASSKANNFYNNQKKGV
jgi:hypothetical protein